MSKRRRTTGPGRAPRAAASGGRRFPSARLALILLGAIGFLWALGHAWVAEDAYITFRTVENAVAGDGLRWNTDERVQVYTHPLWMLLHVMVRWITPNLFLGTIILGLLLSVGAVVMAARAVAKPPGVVAAFLLFPLVLSKGFTEFATSGLETSLSFFLFACFAWTLLRRGASQEDTPWFRLALFASLAGFNRLDNLLIYVPVMAYLLVSRRRHVAWGALVAGSLPLVAWEAFALLYYGFLLPNTAHAKLNTGLPVGLYLQQGLFYLIDFLRRDLGGFLVVLGASAAGWVVLTREPANEARRLPALLALGALPYVGYVIYIGGDFMTLRFWALPTFAAAVGAAGMMPGNPPRKRIWQAAVILLLAKGVSVAAQPAEKVVDQRHERTWHSIGDERLRYAVGHALFTPKQRGWFRFSMKRRDPRPHRMEYRTAVGVRGWWAGPRTLIIDGLALTDPLLARLPAERFSIGHFKRAVPGGYAHARLTGSTEYMQADLARYFETLRLITSGPVFSRKRLSTVMAFNLGRYEPYRKAYLASGHPPQELNDGDYWPYETGEDN